MLFLIWVSGMCVRLCAASSNEIAITGAVGDHSSCTSCQVGDWTDVACDSWCNDGLKGRYRRITAHASADHCEAQSDSNCDLCPKLWDVQPCNTDTSCGKDSPMRSSFGICQSSGIRTLCKRYYGDCPQLQASDLASARARLQVSREWNKRRHGRSAEIFAWKVS